MAQLAKELDPIRIRHLESRTIARQVLPNEVGIFDEQKLQEMPF
ncbi:MAG: hypothetical protein ACTHM9_12035 [Gemmatimonadales bacterium]